MKKLIRNINIFLLFISVVFCYKIHTFAYISCDGNANMYEWENAEDKDLFRPHDTTGCCYSSASVKVKYIEEDRRVYLALFIENGERKDFNGNKTSVIISFNESSDIILFSDSTSTYNEDEFVVRFGYVSDEAGSGCYETDIVLKDVPYEDVITINITLTDYLSNRSQTFKTDIKSEEMKEEESRSVAQAEKDKKTTKAKTTKVKSTKKETTTVLKTAVVTENFGSYSENLAKSNTTIIAIGACAVVTSLGALMVTLFKKK